MYPTGPRLVLAVLLSLPLTVAAQSAAPWSVQVSTIANVNDFCCGGTPYGGEAQLRYTTGAFSFGGGLQYLAGNDQFGVFAPLNTFEIDDEAWDESVSFMGVFFEPRWVYAASDRAAGYLSSRVSASRMKFEDRYAAAYCEDETADPAICLRVEVDEESSFAGLGFTVNLGGGVLIRLTDTVNLDLGATGGIQLYPGGEGSFRDVQTGTADEFSTSETVMNVVVRLGLAFGVGW